MVLAWHRTPGTRTHRARAGPIRYGAAVAAALTLASSALAATGAAVTAGTTAASLPLIAHVNLGGNG